MIEEPVRGKTFSLYGENRDTKQYYNKINKLADICLKKSPDILELISVLDKAGRKKSFLKKQLKTKKSESLINFIVHTAHDMLSPYTTQVNSHLKDLPVTKKITDKVLFTSEEQYHIYMLEIELANRAFAKDFRKAKQKLAFLPHCLRDLDAGCKSVVEGLDYVCKGCSKICIINHVSRLLKENNIKPYLWREANLRSLFKNIKKNKGSLGVLGIACIPELMDGMKLCMKNNIPVVGVPLNANRCMRWTGKYSQTFVNIDELEKLLV